jgi:hypothetical protein
MPQFRAAYPFSWMFGQHLHPTQCGFTPYIVRLAVKNYRLLGKVHFQPLRRAGSLLRSYPFEFLPFKDLDEPMRHPL